MQNKGICNECYDRVSGAILCNKERCKCKCHKDKIADANFDAGYKKGFDFATEEGRKKVQELKVRIEELFNEEVFNWEKSILENREITTGKYYVNREGVRFEMNKLRDRIFEVFNEVK